MYRLFINEEEADLNQKSKIKLSRLVLDLSDLSKRGVRFTNAFTLPPSAKNLRLCGSPQQLATNNNSFEVSQFYTLQDDNTIISQGRVIVKDNDEKKGIKIQLSEGVDFWSVAESRQLNDLVIHDQDFQFTPANMNAKKTRTSDVFLTALLDARGDKTNTALDNYDYTRPCYVFRNVLDRLASELGYSINYGNILDDTSLNSIGCPSNTRDFFVSDYKFSIQNLTVSGLVNPATGSFLYNIGNNVTAISTTLTNNKYKTAYSIKGTVTSKFNTSIDFVFSDRTEKVIIPKGTSFVSFRTDSSEIGTSLSIRANENIVFDDVYIYSVVSEGDIFDANEMIGLDGMYVLADYNLPIMTYKTFIKVFLKMYFLNVDIDNENRVLTINSFGDSINTNNATDLTNKIQRNNSWSSGKIYGKLNALGYSNDNDVDLNLGTVYFNVENENAKETKSFIEIPEFSASNEVIISGNRVVQMPIYDTLEPKRQAVADRIVFFNETGSFGFNATFSEVSFQRLYSTRYFNFIEATKRERLIDFEVFLNYETFVKLQNNPLIFNRDLESYFLVTNIEEFNDEGFSKIQTVKYG